MAQHSAHADVSGLAFHPMKAMMLHEAAEHGLDVLVDEPSEVSVQTELGTLRLEDLGMDQLRLYVDAAAPDGLIILRDEFVSHIAHHSPEVADRIRWSDTPAGGTRPPNFQFADIVARADLSTDFVRMTLRPDRPEVFSDRAIHFRFILPQPDDRSPDWPMLQPNGSTRWPKGEKALHRPVYTVRAQRGDVIDVDIYRHPGGRTVAWVETTEPGDRVALLGPGGGGVLNLDRVILAGDEVAFPAIARLIESLPATTDIRAILHSKNDARDYPFPHHDGFHPVWVAPAASDALATAVMAAKADFPKHFLWFGGPKSQFRALRAEAQTRGLTKENSLLAQYWNDDPIG